MKISNGTLFWWFWGLGFSGTFKFLLRRKASWSVCFIVCFIQDKVFLHIHKWRYIIGFLYYYSWVSWKSIFGFAFTLALAGSWFLFGRTSTLINLIEDRIPHCKGISEIFSIARKRVSISSKWLSFTSLVNGTS